MTLFSQYLRDVAIPFCIYRRGKGWTKTKLEAFKLFPVLLTILFMWGLCAVLTTIALNYPTYTTTPTSENITNSVTYNSWSNTWLYSRITLFTNGTINPNGTNPNPGRTDMNLPLLKESLWFRFPYPCKNISVNIKVLRYAHRIK